MKSKLLIILVFLCLQSYSQSKKVNQAQSFFLNELVRFKNTASEDTVISSSYSSNFFVFFIFYKKAISRHDMPNLCKFHPSCGSYGALAIKNKGLIKGTLATFDRLQRCNGNHYKGQYTFLKSESKYLDLP